MSLGQRPRQAADGSAELTADADSLLRLLSSHGLDEDTRHEVTHALVYYLWPQVSLWSLAAVPEQLRRMVGEHCLAAGIAPDTPPEAAQELMAAFFQRFPPNLVLVKELEEFGLNLVGNVRERAQTRFRRFSDDRPVKGEAGPSGDSVPASPFARFLLETEKKPKTPSAR